MDTSIMDLLTLCQKGNSLLDYPNLCSFDEEEKNYKIILKYFH